MVGNSSRSKPVSTSLGWQMATSIPRFSCSRYQASRLWVGVLARSTAARMPSARSSFSRRAVTLHPDHWRMTFLEIAVSCSSSGGFSRDGQLGSPIPQQHMAVPFSARAYEVHKTLSMPHTPKLDAKQVGCPRCQASAGERCRDADGRASYFRSPL